MLVAEVSMEEKVVETTIVQAVVLRHVNWNLSSE